MTCYTPHQVWRSAHINEKTGKRPITWSRAHAFTDMPLEIACGQCIGCRLKRSREWALRCLAESHLYKENCFITLTYNEHDLPLTGSLIKKDFQDFMKRFRKITGRKIRYYMCGEYGDLLKRPHYHACIFGFDFVDKLLFRKGKDPLYTSALLSRLWPKGYSTIGELTFETAAYVARYVTKKVTGDKKDEHYKGKLPEYTNMSLKPGIGYDWYVHNKNDIFPKDEMVVYGKKCKYAPPKYFLGQYELTNPKESAIIKQRRKDVGAAFAAQLAPGELAERGRAVTQKYIREKIRRYESGLEPIRNI